MGSNYLSSNFQPLASSTPSCHPPAPSCAAFVPRPIINDITKPYIESQKRQSLLRNVHHLPWKRSSKHPPSSSYQEFQAIRRYLRGPLERLSQNFIPSLATLNCNGLQFAFAAHHCRRAHGSTIINILAHLLRENTLRLALLVLLQSSAISLGFYPLE